MSAGMFELPRVFEGAALTFVGVARRVVEVDAEDEGVVVNDVEEKVGNLFGGMTAEKLDETHDELGLGGLQSEAVFEFVEDCSVAEAEPIQMTRHVQKVIEDYFIDLARRIPIRHQSPPQNSDFADQ
jgi:hypothetical protein